MVIAYVFELIFVTLCFASFLPFPQSPNSKIGAIWRAHASATIKIMDTFLDAATFFALSVTIATFGYLSRDLTIYERNMLHHVSLLTMGSLYVVLGFTYKTLRRRKLRCGLVTLTALMTSIMCLVEFYQRSIERPYTFAICRAVDTFFFRPQIVIPASVVIIFEGIGVLASVATFFARRRGRNVSVEIGIPQISNWVLVGWTYLKRTGLFAQKPFTVSEHLDHLRRAPGMTPGLWAVASFGLLVSWSSAIVIFCARGEFQMAAGDYYEENEMGYGQILAALIWLPVLVEYAYFALCKYMGSWKCPSFEWMYANPRYRWLVGGLGREIAVEP